MIHVIAAILLIIFGGMWALFWRTMAVLTIDESNAWVFYLLNAIAGLGVVAIGYGVWMLI
jgi:hypothetical protein